MPPFQVIAGYRFVDLDDAPALQSTLLARAEAAALKGTLLIAAEGLNFTLAGEPDALQGWLAVLRADPRFADLRVHTHGADRLPFKRLRVKLKREIIRMDRPAVRPADRRAATVDALTLARWLAQGRCDAGRPLALLDTRNAFEVDAGAFDGAIDWRLARFGDFPAALAQHRDSLASKTVVSYCTGGIRCEKAALWLAEAGVPNALQLDGGVLGYFAQTAGAPGWHGRCVVFDERGALDVHGTAA